MSEEGLELAEIRVDYAVAPLVPFAFVVERRAMAISLEENFVHIALGYDVRRDPAAERVGAQYSTKSSETIEYCRKLSGRNELLFYIMSPQAFADLVREVGARAVSALNRFEK